MRGVVAIPVLVLAAGCAADHPGGPCGPLEYFDYGDDRCGEGSGEGTCRPRATVCPDDYEPTCGCDGEIHGNGCEAASAGTDVNDNGTCGSTAGLFPCGHGFCDPTVAYCEHFTSDLIGTPDNWTCRPLPGACGVDADCDCMAGELCENHCDDSAGGVVLTCYGG